MSNSISIKRFRRIFLWTDLVHFGFRQVERKLSWRWRKLSKMFFGFFWPGAINSYSFIMRIFCKKTSSLQEIMDEGMSSSWVLRGTSDWGSFIRLHQTLTRKVKGSTMFGTEGRLIEPKETEPLDSKTSALIDHTRKQGKKHLTLTGEIWCCSLKVM